LALIGTQAPWQIKPTTAPAFAISATSLLQAGNLLNRSVQNPPGTIKHFTSSGLISANVASAVPQYSPKCAI